MLAGVFVRILNSIHYGQGPRLYNYLSISDSDSSKLNGWSWACAQYQPINMPECESEIWVVWPCAQARAGPAFYKMLESPGSTDAWYMHEDKDESSFILCSKVLVLRPGCSNYFWLPQYHLTPTVSWNYVHITWRTLRNCTLSSRSKPSQTKSDLGCPKKEKKWS